DWTRIRGFTTDAGSRTYHTAILARSLGVPAVVGLHNVSTRVPPGAAIIIDGASGEVIVDPAPPVRLEAERRARERHSPMRQAAGGGGPVKTGDGVRVLLQANIEGSEDGPAGLAAGGEGIGLFRSEFMLGGGPPDMAAEGEQYHVYRGLVERMGG